MKLMNLKDKIFLAGASGMVGSAILNTLKEKGYGEEKKGGEIFKPTREELDLTDTEEVKRWFEKNKPNIVIIAAATVGGIEDNRSRPGDFILENLKIETNIIDQAFKNNVRRLLFLGSSCIYPKNCRQPIREEELLTGQLEKTNESYAIAKIAGIKLIEALRKQYEFDGISLMPTNLYGIGDNYKSKKSHLIPAMIKRFEEAKRLGKTEVACWGTGKPFRELLNSKDLALACIFALEEWNPKDKDSPKDIYGNELSYLNIGTGKDMAIKEIAKMVANAVGYKGLIKWDSSKPDGTFKKQLDIKRISKMGWKSKITLEKGLLEAVEDFRKKRIQGKLRE